jgi:putative MFS transporter
MSQPTIGSVELDDVPLNRFHFRLTALTFGAHFNDGFGIGAIGIALTLLAPEMGLSDAWRGAIGSAMLLGLFLGSAFFGWISDRLGRIIIFTSSFAVITLFTFLQFFVTEPWQLFVLRVLIGIGVGGDYTVGHALLAEFLPRKHRGEILGSFSVIWTFGYVLAALVGIAFINAQLANAWRWLLILPGFIAAIVLVARLGTPESPRWLMRHGRVDEATAILRKYFGPDVYLHSEEAQETTGGYAELFSRTYIKRTAFNAIFFACLVMPYFAIYTFLPSILAAMGLSGLTEQGGGFATEVYLNVFLLAGAIMGIYLTHKLSRRGFLIGAFIILTASLTLLAVLPSSLALIQVILFAGFTFVLSAVSNLVGVFPAESFPTRLRSSGVGFATAISRLGSVVSTFLLPILLTNFGITVSMLALAGSLLVGTVVSIAWAPETKNRTLAEASEVD